MRLVLLLIHMVHTLSTHMLACFSLSYVAWSNVHVLLIVFVSQCQSILLHLQIKMYMYYM